MKEERRLSIDEGEHRARTYEVGRNECYRDACESKPEVNEAQEEAELGSFVYDLETERLLGRPLERPQGVSQD